MSAPGRSDEIGVMCPSARCCDGALLIGIVLSNGTIAYSGTRVEIDSRFVEVAHHGRNPEKRFRFASPCLAGGCRQWASERCTVADRVVEDLAPNGRPIPTCAIRPDCRWFRQRGLAACHICPEIVTDGSDRIAHAESVVVQDQA